VISLKAERLNRGLSLTAAADEIDVPLNVLARAESGEGMPHPANAKKIADFYGYKVTEVWPLDDERAEVAA
jgi:ribosome-binding protein aMBF1 (putative translation factor)